MQQKIIVAHLRLLLAGCLYNPCRRFLFVCLPGLHNRRLQCYLLECTELCCRRVLWCPVGRSLSRPFAVAGDFCRCLWMRSGVINGRLLRNPKFAARRRVCSGGQNKTWCMYFTRFCRCGMVCTLLIVCDPFVFRLSVTGRL